MKKSEVLLAILVEVVFDVILYVVLSCLESNVFMCKFL